MRFSRMESSMSMKQADCLKLLPLLFHVNHPMLPGYVDKFTPNGLPNYSPSKTEKKIAKTVSQSFAYKPRAHLSYKISSLFLMGSMGTLGQSPASDIDLWICLAERLPNKSLVKLKKKATYIKEWFATIGIELNFYCVHSDDFSLKKDKMLEVDSCGNTQNYLLLDEFYRTSVWLAGRWPLWWVIPEEMDYSHYSKRLIRQKHIDSSDWIDFGDVKTIPAAEYFSAALWQLYKAIDSPYKSSVKLLVLEVYAQLHPCAGILSNQLKAQVHDGDVLKQELDPYLQILRFAQQALKNSPKRLEFLRRAFYLKANLKIKSSNKIKPNSKRKLNWRYKLLQDLVESWNWKSERLDYLNSRHQWNIHQVKGERSDLIKELTNSYHFLSSFSRVQGVIDRVAKNELLSLGRRLYSSFERRAGKIDRLNTGIVKELFEARITLLQDKDKWALYLGHIPQKSKRLHQTAFVGRSLFECLCWGCFNGVISPSTRLHVYQRDDYSNLQLANDINKDLAKLVEFFDSLDGQQDFDKPAKIMGFGVFINTENDPLSQEKQKDLYHVANQSDCFSWAGGDINLAGQFDLVMLNSWGEITTQSFSGDTAWIEFFAQHKDELDFGGKIYPIYCRRLVQKDQLVERVRDILLKWQQLLVNSGRTGYSNRHLMTIKKKWLMVDLYQSSVNYSLNASLLKLYDGLAVGFPASTHSVSTKIHLDPFVKISSFCERALQRRLPQGLDFYIHQQANRLIEVLVLSFNGCVHYQTHKQSSRDQIIGHYQQFFDKVQNRNLLNHGLLETIRFYEYIELSGKKKAYFKTIEIQPDSVMQKFALVQAIAVNTSMGSRFANQSMINPTQMVFDLFTAESSFSYAAYGDRVYQKLQKQLLKMRAKGDNYPIFLTDLDLSAVLNKVSIIEALGFKKKIESKLNKGL